MKQWFTLRRPCNWHTLMLLLMCLLASVSLQAQPVSAQFKKANQHYQEQAYQKAITLYEDILSKGYEAPELYFNLGNAYYKEGNIPAAILNYERAKKMAPYNEDIQYNLQLANKKVVDKIEPVPELFIARWWKNIVRWQSAHTWAIIALLLLWLSCAAAAIYLLANTPRIKKWNFFGAGLGFLLFLITMIPAYQQYQYQNRHNQAIVFAKSTNVKSAPDKESTDLFVLHEGVKVQLIDQLDNWRKIRLADGKTGWIPADVLQTI